ncbi:ubiquinol--cytochrome-c reductase subunit 8 [Dimargaris cristalligena]|uniref:Cytochrome b-c1 complex subunit 8 n=1 Tax=Dimargaris cristalligena TaxID=215637 RepID=A0A4P9ZV20_9FUNG|nr:ubiquinol--cytochrome-c reductase subunit 8 [Dimargaris cristalligena]RKP37415.1 cytochrome b-c1 complex subunit 8 [Dimargaris cristalligena]|eukprot:RKP37415.1 cytochrome b-c1 complex subunit 8 [Dimargaris cristalligena]
MGDHSFGNLGGPKQRGIVSYRLSSYEQRVFAGVFKKGFYNVIRRFSANVLYIGPPMIASYMVYSWAKKRNTYLNSKAGHHELSG